MKNKQTSNKKKSKKQNYLKVAGSAMMVSAMIPNLSLVESMAANPTQTVTFSQSLSQNQSKTLNIPNLVRVVNITTNNGTVNYSINGDNLTINVSGGNPTGTQYNATKYSKSVTNSLTNSTNVFPSTNSYSDGSGYTGTLNQSGTSFVASGSYTPADTKTATDYIESTTNSFPATKDYNSGGYTGTLSKSGSVTSRSVETGGYWTSTGHWESTGHYEETGYWKETGHYESTGGFWDTNPCGAVDTQDQCVPTREWISGGQVWVSDGSTWVSTGTKWVSDGSVWVDDGDEWVATYTTYYRQNYSGNVTKSAVDTRVYQQNYNGTVYKGENENLYGYTVNVEYITDITPPIPATFTASTTSPTNQNVSVTVNYPADATVKQYKVGATGTWTSYTTPVVLSSNDTVYARSFDEAGNLSDESSYVVNNIDKTPPVLATLTVDKTTPTNTDVKVTVSYPADASVKQYKIGSTGSWTTYSTPVVVVSNNTVYARSYDQAGNVSGESNIAVSNIDKTAPSTPSLTADLRQNTFTVGNVVDSGLGVKEAQYKVDSGAWTKYSSAVTVADGSHTIQVKTIDVAGNESTVQSQTFDFYKNRLASATTAVVKAESTKVQVDVDSAKTLVNALPTSTDKTSLTNRVTEVQNQINAKLAVEKVEATDTRADLQLAKSAVVLVLDATVSSELSDRIVAEENYIKQIEAVEALVVKAETSMIQADVDAVKTPLSQLEADDQVEFQNRLDDVQAVIDARIAVQKATETRNEEDVKDAQVKIDLLNNSNPVIIDILDDIQSDFEVADILSLVSKERYDVLSTKYGMSKVAYNSLVQSYYAIKYTGDNMYKMASDKFALVPTSDKHYALVEDQFDNLNADYDDFVQDRVQTDAEIKAESSVKAMESNYDPTYVAHTQELIDAVEDVTVRSSLQQRLDTAKAKYEASQLDKASADAIASVEKAESTKQTYYVDIAYGKVNALTNETLKADLTKRLQALQAQMALDKKIADATRTVELAEQYKQQSYIDSAQTKINALPSGEAKTSLQQRLDVVKAGLPTSDQATIIKQATNYVSLAQSLKTQYYVDKAQGYINQILDAVKKAELQAKLDAVVVK